MLTWGVASHLRLVCVRCDLNPILNGVVLIIQDGRIFQRCIWRGFGFHTRFELVDVAFDNSAIADLYAVCDRTKSLQYNARYPLIWTTVVPSQYSCSGNQGTRLGMLVMLCFLLGLLRHHLLLCIWLHKIKASTQWSFHEEFVL